MHCAFFLSQLSNNNNKQQLKIQFSLLFVGSNKPPISRNTIIFIDSFLSQQTYVLLLLLLVVVRMVWYQQVWYCWYYYQRRYWYQYYHTYCMYDDTTLATSRQLATTRVTSSQLKRNTVIHRRNDRKIINLSMFQQFHHCTNKLKHKSLEGISFSSTMLFQQK